MLVVKHPDQRGYTRNSFMYRIDEIVYSILWCTWNKEICYILSSSSLMKPNFYHCSCSCLVTREVAAEVAEVDVEVVVCIRFVVFMFIYLFILFTHFTLFCNNYFCMIFYTPQIFAGVL